MPEVRLAWRAALCHGSHDSHVVVGLAPDGEQRAVARVLPGLRVYDLPAAGGASHSACRGMGAGGDALGVLPLSRARPGEPWESMLTVALRDGDALGALVDELRAPGATDERPFVACVNLDPARERRLFEALRAAPAPGGIPDLIRLTRDLCARSLDAPG